VRGHLLTKHCSLRRHGYFKYWSNPEEWRYSIRGLRWSELARQSWPDWVAAAKCIASTCEVLPCGLRRTGHWLKAICKRVGDGMADYLLVLSTEKLAQAVRVHYALVG
jgi:hypothetical protein